MSRVSTTAKRYTGSAYSSGSSYSSHYGSSYGSSLTPGLSSYKPSSTSSSGYSSSSYLSSRPRNYSSSSEPEPRGRPAPRADLLTSRGRSESLSRPPARSYGAGLSSYGAGLSGGAGYTSYAGYSSSSSSSSSPPSSGSALTRRRSVSQSDLCRDLSGLGLAEPSSSSSSSSSSALRGLRGRASEAELGSPRAGYSSLARSSTQEALRSSGQEATSSSSSSSRALSSWERSSAGRSSSPCRDPSNSKNTPGLVGLRNLGNTCFMNSILQCLSSTAGLREYCQHNQHRRDLSSSRNNTALMEEFARLLQTLWSPGNSEAVSPSEFKTQIQRYAPRFVGYNQQDAQEFLRFLLDGLHNEVNRVSVRPRGSDDYDHLPDEEKGKKMWSKYLEREDSKIVDLFVGQLKSSLTCSHCGYCSTVFDPFWDLSLPIAKKGSEVSLMDCMRLFTKEDVLDGDEKPTCYRCKTRRRCTKKFTVQKFPKILVLHLKRFSEARVRTSKLSTFVNFPLKDLDLQEFNSGNSSHVVYNLYAVSNHSGTTMGGHYTAYCRNPASGEWYTFNDSRVSPMSSSQVRSSDGYVLFYELA